MAFPANRPYENKQGRPYYEETGFLAAGCHDAPCERCSSGEAPEGYPAIVEEMIQAEPLTITIYDYWSGDGARVAEPSEEQ